MKNAIIILLILTLFVGCGRSARRNGSGGEPGVVAVVAPDTVSGAFGQAVAIPSDSGIVRMALVDGQGEITIRKTAWKEVLLDFPATGYHRLWAEVTPLVDTIANLRISGIVLSDSVSDGPFGRTVEYDLPGTGCVRLVIGESLMQGDPWGGDFTAEIRLTRRASAGNRRSEF
ncbi:MAG: hypothetical protein LBM20_05660 [Rikenellaceae bacterium]|jgi:hypothetical protein|nr:hypothetical protein [Rikenellaceae bacterium]